MWNWRPAVIGQFGADVRLWKIKAALKEVGFADVYEVALGADIGASTEAKQYVNEVKAAKSRFFLHPVVQPGPFLPKGLCRIW